MGGILFCNTVYMCLGRGFSSQLAADFFVSLFFSVIVRDVVSVSRQSRELTTSRLGQSALRLGLGPIRLGPRVGLGPKHLSVLSLSRAISCRWSRRFVRRVRSVAQYSRRLFVVPYRPICFSP